MHGIIKCCFRYKPKCPCISYNSFWNSLAIFASKRPKLFRQIKIVLIITLMTQLSHDVIIWNQRWPLETSSSTGSWIALNGGFVDMQWFSFSAKTINANTKQLWNPSQLTANKANLGSSSVSYHLLSDIYPPTWTLPDHRIYSYHWLGRLPGHQIYGYCTYRGIQNGTWEPTHKQFMRKFVKIVSL